MLIAVFLFTRFPIAMAGTDVTCSFTALGNDVYFDIISVTPSNIRINSTGFFNITVNATGQTINASSILFAFAMNNTCFPSLNTSYYLGNDWLPDKQLIANRGEGYWFETMNSETGTGELGYIGEWGIHNETLHSSFTVNEQGEDYYNFTTKMRLCGTMEKIYLVNPNVIKEEDKSAQYHVVDSNDEVKVNFNMTDTEMFSSIEGYNETQYCFFFYSSYTGNTKPLRVYYVNESYGTEPVTTSDYSALVGLVNDTDAYQYTSANSSYYILRFSSNETGYVGNVKMTENFSFVFDRDPGAGEWRIHYANDNVTSGTRYYNFSSSETTYTRTTDTNPWNLQQTTGDVFLNARKLDNKSRFEYKIYGQTNAHDTGNGTWSSTYVDLIDESNLAPNPVDILNPNATETYTAGTNLNIQYKWIGDPNHEPCWVNITVHNETHQVADYVVNQSISQLEREANQSSFSYLYDLTPLSTGENYHINITVTDPYGLTVHTEQNGTFQIQNAELTFLSPYPENNSYVEPTDHYMNITVINSNGSAMDVNFYWANNDSLIATDTDVANNTQASVIVTFSYTRYQNYSWYAKVWDNTSTDYNFTGEAYVWDVDRSGDITLTDLTSITTHYGETGDNHWIRQDTTSNGVIGLSDITYVAYHYGEEY